MATITLTGGTFGCTMGMGVFEGIGVAFTSAKSSSSVLSKALGTLKSKIDLASVAAKVETSQEQTHKAEEREFAKKSSLSLAYEKLNTLIADTGSVDMKASSKIRERKDAFYDRYYYLKPECEKNKREKVKDALKKGWDGLCSIGNAIKTLAINVAEWVKGHWKELLIGLAFIVVGALITVFTGGAATGFWAAFGVALLKGLAAATISAAIGGTISAGCTYYQYRKAGFSHATAMKNAKNAFGDGAANGFMTGGIGFAAGAGFLGVFGKGFLVGHSFWGSVGRGALFGATTNAITSPISTAISYWLKNDTLKGSGNLIIQSTISGIISGGIFGGIMGGAQFKYSEYKVNKIESNIANRTDLRATQKGKMYETQLIDEFRKRYPDSNCASQCRLNSNNLINKNGNSSYQMPDLLVENGNGNFVNYDFKWGNAGKTYIQNQLTSGGNAHVMDTTITGANGVFSTNKVPAGTPFIEIHQGTFNSIVGVPINSTVVTGGSTGIDSGLRSQ